VLSGINFVSMLTAVRMLMANIFGINMAIITMSAVAVDRLICVVAPMM
jgi:hypothetical protein